MPYVANLIESVEQSVQTQNWHAALAVTLTLPDVCGRIQNPNERSTIRYVAWYEAYVLPKYTLNVGWGRHERTIVHLSGSDCYALRCAYLHEGNDNIESQRARVVVKQLRFVIPSPASRFHKVSIRDADVGAAILCLQVDEFCADMCESVREWYAAIVEPGSAAAVNEASLMELFPMTRRFG